MLLPRLQGSSSRTNRKLVISSDAGFHLYSPPSCVPAQRNPWRSAGRSHTAPASGSSGTRLKASVSRSKRLSPWRRVPTHRLPLLSSWIARTVSPLMLAGLSGSCRYWTKASLFLSNLNSPWPSVPIQMSPRLSSIARKTTVVREGSAAAGPEGGEKKRNRRPSYLVSPAMVPNQR